MSCWDTLFQTNLTRHTLIWIKPPEATAETEERLGSSTKQSIRLESRQCGRNQMARGVTTAQGVRASTTTDDAVRSGSDFPGGAATSTFFTTGCRHDGRTLKVTTTWELKDTTEPFTTVLAFLDSGSCISGITKEFLLRIRTE